MNDQKLKKQSTPKQLTVKTDDIIGEKVLSKTGEEIGKIKELHIHPTALSVEGILVDKGLFKTNHYIGKGYISRLSNEGAVLNVDPVTEIKGKIVFDVTGAEIGKVKGIKREGDTNKLISITVDRGAMTEDILIADNVIKEIGENVMLTHSMKS